MKIISFSGKKRVGKDICAKYLIEKYGFTKKAFADPVKEFCSQALSIPLEYFNRDDLKDKPFPVSIQLYASEVVQIIEDLILLEELHVERINWSAIPHEKNLKTPREVMQFIGTDLGRNIVSKNIWINQMTKELLGLDNVVITDARMSNERTFIKTLGAKTALIVKDVPSEDSHESENDLGDPKEYDAILYNLGTIDDLFRNLERIIK